VYLYVTLLKAPTILEMIKIAVLNFKICKLVLPFHNCNVVNICL